MMRGDLVVVGVGSWGGLAHRPPLVQHGGRGKKIVRGLRKARAELSLQGVLAITPLRYNNRVF